MGVKGLWTLLEPAGYPISLESLEGKIIAVDISIWINQSIKGIRDKRGILAENAHLLGLFNRICKLLFYKIKPVFVFDGGAPALKRQTIEERRLRRENILAKAKSNVNKVLKSYLSEKLQKDIEFEDEEEELADVGFGLKEWTAKDEGNLFVLPDDSPKKEQNKNEKEVDEDDWQEFAFSAHPKLKHFQDESLIDTESEDFKSLPPEIRHELLHEIREKKKKLNKVENIPTETDDFSDYQMQRILVRRKIQEKMEELQNEMVASVSNKASNFLPGSYEGITAQRVMSDDSTHFIYMNKRRFEKEDGPSKFLMPKKRKEEREREFCPKKMHRDLYVSVNDFDFGISEEAAKEGSTSLREKIKRETPKLGSVLKFESKPKPKLDKTFSIPHIVHNSSVIQSSESESDDDFIEVDEIKTSYDESEDQVKSAISNKQVPTSTMFDETRSVIDINEDIGVDKQDSLSFVQKAKKVADPRIFINFDEPIASTSKEADEIEAQIANLSNNSDSESLQLSPPISHDISSTREDILGNLAELKDRLEKDDEQSYDSDETLGDDLVIEQEVKFSGKGLEPSEVQILPTPVIIKSHHFESTHTTPTKSKERVITSKITPDKTPKSAEKRTPIKQSVNSTPIKVLRSSELTHELGDQLRDMKKAERQTSTVAQNMISECRELLSMFGIPYVMSPMEAEAQCAALEIQGLTHGTITDDSDVWLFGGKTVFKNFFNQSKFVEMYRITDIEEKLKLDRETMICVAMLTGCDYSDGVEGVGPVKATEILSEFPGKGLERLRSFKEWWLKKKKGNDKSPGNKQRAQLLKLSLSENFPSDLVYKAFMSPIVLDSSEPFSWGMPDLDLLRRYAAEKMRWSKEKIDSNLIPIIKKLNEKQNQLRIDQFIKLRSNNNKMVYSSKRLANAVNKISGSNETTVEVAATDNQGMSKLREKVKNQRKKGRTTNQRNQVSTKIIAKKSTGLGDKLRTQRSREPETIQLSESSSDGE